jgi:hypothetical protein
MPAHVCPAGGEFNGALARQGAQMVFGGIGRFEPQRLGDFCSRWRKAGAGDFGFNEFKYLLLPRGKFAGHNLFDCI